MYNTVKLFHQLNCSFSHHIFDCGTSSTDCCSIQWAAKQLKALTHLSRRTDHAFAHGVAIKSHVVFKVVLYPWRKNAIKAKIALESHLVLWRHGSYFHLISGHFPFNVKKLWASQSSKKKIEIILPSKICMCFQFLYSFNSFTTHHSLPKDFQWNFNLKWAEVEEVSG